MAMFNQIISSLVIIVLNIILQQIAIISGDCGLPAIPVHSKIRPLKSLYYEDDSVEYYCEFSDMKLMDGRFRHCAQSKWIGDIPQCAREIPRRLLDTIEIVDIQNYTIDQTYADVAYSSYDPELVMYHTNTFFGKFDQNQCLKGDDQSADQTDGHTEWRLRFASDQFSVYHIEIVVHTDEIRHSTPDPDNPNSYRDLVARVLVNEYRQCAPVQFEPLDTSGRLVKYGFRCALKSSDSNIQSDDFYRLRFLDRSDVRIQFTVGRIIVCELHVYQTFMSRWSPCGSPDIPLHSNYSSVFGDSQQARNPIGFQFDCEPGFRLIGDSAVLCGLDTRWMSDFPKCVPDHECPLADRQLVRLVGLSVDYKHLYSSDGNITAIKGSQAIYSCAEPENSLLNKTRTLIGDSVRFCQSDGQWSGEQPICVDDTELTIYLAEFNENLLLNDSILPKFPRLRDSRIDCGIPAIPAYSKIFSIDKFLIESDEEIVDLQAKYTNGSIITYHCQSRFSLMISDFDLRVCVNGSWVGDVGRCYRQIGGSNVVRVYNIYAYSLANGYETIGQFYNYNDNSTLEYWNFFQSDPNQCASFAVKRGQPHVWRIELTRSVPVSYFLLRFETIRLFADLEDRSEPKNGPLSAKIRLSYGDVRCDAVRVRELADIMTLVSFRCDYETGAVGDDANPYYTAGELLTSVIELSVDVDRFHDDFNATNVTLCGLTMFEGSSDCGTPEELVNGRLAYDDDSSAAIRYECDAGYRLVGGPALVRCGRNGKWLDPFPRCELYKLCEWLANGSDSTPSETLYETAIIDGRPEPVLGTIAEYSCAREDIVLGRRVLVGPRSAVCTASGKWSTSEPVCRDEKPVESSERSSSMSRGGLTVAIVLICGISFIGAAVILAMNVRFKRFTPIATVRGWLRRERPLSSSYASYDETLGESNGGVNVAEDDVVRRF